MDEINAKKRELVSTQFGYIHIAMEGTGTPIVMLHMSPLSVSMFDRVTRPLSAHRTVVAVDRLGFGASDPIRQRMRLADYVQATLEALSVLGVERFDVVGIHTGSMEAIEMACEAPERVRSTTLVGLVVLFPDEAEEFRRAVAAPEPSSDGAHLRWHWEYWDHVRTISSHARSWPPSLTHERVFDHLASWPDAKAT